MSKLIDKLNQIAKAVPQPIGFRAAQSASPKTELVLIANVTQATNISGADAVLISQLSPGAKALQKIARSLPNIPWGLILEDINRKGIRPMIEAGCDFVVFPASAAIALPDDDKIGKVLQVESSLSEGLIRAINELPADAVLIAREQEGECPITWRHLMLFQRFADLLTKPLLVPVPLNMAANELQILWEIGVDGVVAEVGGERPGERLEELRQTIDKLTLAPRQRRKTEALLPRIGGETSPAAETEEEEEEEEE